MSKPLQVAKDIVESVSRSVAAPCIILLVSHTCPHCTKTLAELDMLLYEREKRKGPVPNIIVVEKQLLPGVQLQLQRLSHDTPKDIGRSLRQIARVIKHLEGYPTFVKQMRGVSDIEVAAGGKTALQIEEFITVYKLLLN